MLQQTYEKFPLKYLMKLHASSFYQQTVCTLL